MLLPKEAKILSESIIELPQKIAKDYFSLLESSNLTYYELRRFISILLKVSKDPYTIRVLNNINKCLTALEIRKVSVPTVKRISSKSKRIFESKMNKLEKFLESTNKTRQLIGLTEADLNVAQVNRTINDKEAFALITAFRDEFKKDEGKNQERNKKLRSDIESLGYELDDGVRGRYIQNRDTPEQTFAREDSFFVRGPKLEDTEACEKFTSDMLKLCKKYQQESVIINTPEQLACFTPSGAVAYGPWTRIEKVPTDYKDNASQLDSGQVFTFV